MYNLGTVLRDLGEPSAAAGFYERVFRADSAVLGLEHADALGSLEKLAMSVYEAADFERAAALWGQLADSREHTLGESNTGTLQALDTQSNAYQKAGDEANARRVRERLVDITRRAYGLTHPITALSIKNLATLLAALGDHDAAMLALKELFIAARAAGIPLPPGAGAAE